MDEFNKYLKGTDLNFVKEVCVNKEDLFCILVMNIFQGQEM